MLSKGTVKSAVSRAALGVVLWIALGPAQAFTIDSSLPFQSFTVTWSLLSGQTDPNGNTNNTGIDITGSAAFEFTGFDENNNEVTFELTLENTTEANALNIGLEKFGFGTTPNLTVKSWSQISGDADKVSDVAELDQNDSDLDNAVAPGNMTLIDVVTATGTGAQNTLQAGEKDTFKLVLELALGQSADVDALKSVVFSPFAVKYQSDQGSFEFAGNGNASGGPAAVPVPGTLLLLGVGVLVLRRFRSRD